MNFSIETENAMAIKTNLLVIMMHDGKISSHPLASSADKALNGELKKILEKENFEGKPNQTKLLNTHNKISAEYVLMIGLGEPKKFTLEILRRSAAKAAKTAKQIKATHLTASVHTLKLKNFSDMDLSQAFVEGVELAGYEFTRYKKPDKNTVPLKEATLLCSRNKTQEVLRGITRGEALAKGVSLARDLINTPASDMTPLDLAKTARTLKGVQVKVLNEAQIRQLKMGAYLGVAQGSIHPPAFIEMHYRPTGHPKKKVVLVGKGVTFDSGGLSLKPPKFMETMKDDMSGAAAVIGLMSVISTLKPNVEVWGLVAAAENMPDAKAQRPGDIVRAMNGKTIEVLNTDAEGRLTLADAICYAAQKKPDYIVDTATLTGACLVALGDRYSGIMGNDKKLVQKLITAGDKSGEMIWELPLPEEYKEELKSPIADLKNVGGNYGGTINGGLFIQEFVGDNKWAHIDMAGPSWTEKPRDYEFRGGTGVMVRTFAEFLECLN